MFALPHQHPTRRHCLLCAGAQALGLWMPQAAQASPTVTDGHWIDSARARQLPWRVRLPAGDGPCALVIFSHGLGGSVEAGTVWGQAWSAAGLAVLHLQHPGSDAETLRGGLLRLRAAASGEQLAARVADVRFVLDELQRRALLTSAPTEPPWARLQLTAVGVAGHSFGAHTVQAVAGQRFAASTAFVDTRPRAFIAFSPSQPRGGSALSLAESFGAIRRPFLAITGSEDGDPFGSYDNGTPRAQVFEGLPLGRRALLWLDGADHMSFSGQDLAARGAAPAAGPFRRQGPAAERQAEHHALVARITTDWWRSELLDDAQARARLAAPAGLGANDRWRQN